MVIPKIELIIEAYSKLRINGLTSKSNSEETTLALRRMTGVIASLPWNVGYIMPESIGDDDPNDDSGITVDTFDPLTTIIAHKVSGDFGKPGAISPTEYYDACEILARKFVEVEGSKYPEILPVGGANQYPDSLSNYFYKGCQPSENSGGDYS